MGIRIRPEVRKFAEAMELELRKSDGDGPTSAAPHNYYQEAGEALRQVASMYLGRKQEKPTIVNESAKCAIALLRFCCVCGVLETK